MKEHFYDQKIPQLHGSTSHSSNKAEELYKKDNQQTRATDKQTVPKYSSMTDVPRTDHFRTSFVRLGVGTEALPQSTYKDTMYRPPTEDIRIPKYKPIGDKEVFLRRIYQSGHAASLLPSLPGVDVDHYQTTHRAAYNPSVPPCQQRHETAPETPEDSWMHRKRKSMFYGNARNHVTGLDTWADELCTCSVCSLRPQKPDPPPPEFRPGIKTHFPGIRK